MNAARFDEIVRDLFVRTYSRRIGITLLLSNVVGLGIAPSRELVDAKKKKKKRKGKKKRKRKKKRPDNGGGGPALRQCPNVVKGGSSGIAGLVPGGKRFVSSHGYNDPANGFCDVGNSFPDHCDNQKFGLDFDTNADTIMTPADGTIWALPNTAFDSKLAAIRLDDGDVNLNLGHMKVGQLFVRTGDRVLKGQCLGTVSDHIHASLDDRHSNMSEKPPLEFTGQYAIQGKSLPWNGSTENQWGRSDDCLDFHSNNRTTCPTVLQVEAAVQDPLTQANVVAPMPNHRFIPIAVLLRRGGEQHELSGTARYNESRGAYAAALQIGGQIQLGQDYNVEVRFADRVRTLWGNAGSLRLRAGARNGVTVTLVPGDVNGDNSLSILDYNIIASCYQYPGNGIPPSCTAEWHKASDLNDDGVVNEFDLNLFTRALSSI